MMLRCMAVPCTRRTSFNVVILQYHPKINRRSFEVFFVFCDIIFRDDYVGLDDQSMDDLDDNNDEDIDSDISTDRMNDLSEERAEYEGNREWKHN